MLELLGLDPESEAVYRQMLADPHGGVDELRLRLGLSEKAVRAALDKLADLTLLRASRDDPGRLRPVSPERGLELILRRQEEELARRQQELTLSRAAAARAVAEYADLRPEAAPGAPERLEGLDAIQAKLEVLTQQLTEECLSVMPGGAQSAASLEASKPLDQDAMERGVRIMTLYQDSVRNDQATFAYAQWMTSLGGKVRTAPILPPRLLIFDRRVAVVPIDPANTRRGALCTSEPGIVASLVALFEQTWTTAVPLGAGRGEDADTGLSPGERELLRLLATGLTDEAAGKRLGVSLRTVRRQMAALMERLGAASRFEAGLKAAQRGWL
ncbi:MULTISPECIES: helix-turn-helix transcriptional regulator [Kitasatospora]|uniref:DNA-binding CsgD family transcriptional regulator/sugar-specific transcriptional regulator TrmB n=2 Tax=Kitasatospora TaxID=2063 RepID=A0ABT1J5V6_9ACTN|nr:helix-turn-helix transcriptional regulator [Kitasatospora paracochleata]MCP2312509.1 DNA-binding CsgD family transcriptional regulator/sugar-specific transcriptional regulator TrmB [Kitasatospora paracochleata]